jgi:hypothetical protein
VTYEHGTSFTDLVRIQTKNIPSDLYVLVEEGIVDDLANPTIIDYVKEGDFELTYIPPVPRPLKEYVFYSPSSEEDKGAGAGGNSFVTKDAAQSL